MFFILINPVYPWFSQFFQPHWNLNIYFVCSNTMCVSTCQVEFVFRELSFFNLLPRSWYLTMQCLKSYIHWKLVVFQQSIILMFFMSLFSVTITSASPLLVTLVVSYDTLIFKRCFLPLLRLGKIFKNQASAGLKAVDTIGNCQILAFTVGVSQHMHKITNL